MEAAGTSRLPGENSRLVAIPTELLLWIARTDYVTDDGEPAKLKPACVSGSRQRLRPDK